MTNAWISGTVIATLVGVVGFFVVMRASSFAAHAIPNGAFAGAAGANLVGINPLFGLVIFALGAALGIGYSSRRTRSDVATALALATGAVGDVHAFERYMGALAAVKPEDVARVAKMLTPAHRDVVTLMVGPEAPPAGKTQAGKGGAK